MFSNNKKMNHVVFRSNDDIRRNIFGNSESEPGNQGTQSLMRWVHDWPIGYSLSFVLLHF